MTKIKNRIKKNDMAEVIAGKEKGKRGKVLLVYPERGRVLVENLNMIKRHTRPNEQNQQGGIIEKEASLHVSNVMPVCRKCDAPVRIRHLRLDNDKKVRICVKCGEPFDKV